MLLKNSNSGRFTKYFFFYFLLIKLGINIKYTYQ